MASTAIVHSGRVEKLPGGVCSIDHYIKAPLDHFSPSSREAITVYVREVFAEKFASNASLPLLVYLQGGPGFPSPRLTAPPSGWLKTALSEFRVLLLDQRGTGLSSPLTAQTCRHFADPAALAAYLTHFRADSIVHDVELFRKTLFPTQKLTLLGQSFGGFCNLSFLSFFPQSLERVIFTCGLAPVGATAQEVYEATYASVAERNRRYYARYPGDKLKVVAIVKHLMQHPAPLPSGGVLTARRFLTLGMPLGTVTGMETIHYLIESAWATHFHGQQADATSAPELSYAFHSTVGSMQSSFDTNPIYWFLHESIYCDGPTYSPSAWAAEAVHARTRVGGVAMFDPTRFDGLDGEALTEAVNAAPLYFSGEMVFSWMADDYAMLKPFKAAADILAQKSDWRPLYDQAKLRNIDIPSAALVSFDDLFVDRTLSLGTAALLGDTCRVFVSNEFQHGGLRDDPSIFEKLLKMTKGEIILPS
ncbi:unnamed protein product [Aphanomyces euteiches]|uniref:AB hydrolase-1 domain-containing protein n=1 Tax=Aphanomyces euteiches TaxID=100861 RepID=A0A6G0XBF3_9STRA|nr:hypothetical protein Ae201684_006646 [Aphanomyces euteiches]KAH9091199.1 hypothetical protein Ae201684P_006599 [Aphanomyces euteiches]KAH9148779.1 hypothetical protein AeRB84_007964 [Aphanomyces euteiches]